MNSSAEDNLVQMTECARLESIRASSQCRADQGRALGGHRMNHEQSKRTILIAGIGTSPAVLTETVWLTQLKIAGLFGVETVQAEGGRTVVQVQTKEPPLQGIFYQGRYWDAKLLLIKFIRRASYLRRRENGRRNHPWASRLDPQGDIGTPRIRQRQEVGIFRIESCAVKNGREGSVPKVSSWRK